MAELGVSVLIKAVDRITAPVRAISKSTTGLQNQLSQTREKLSGLNSKAQKIEGFRAFHAKVADTAKQLQAAQKETTGLAQSLIEAGKVSAELKEKLNASQKVTAGYAKDIEKAKTGISYFSDELKTAKEKAKALSQSIKSTKNPTKELSDQFEAAKERVGSLSEKLNESRGSAKALRELYRSAKTQTRELTRSFKEAEKPTKSLTRSFEQAKRKTVLLKQAHQKEAVQLEQLRRGMTTAGISTRNLGKEQRKLKTDSEAVNRTLDRQTSKLSGIAAMHKKLAAITTPAKQITANLGKVTQETGALAGMFAKIGGGAVAATTAIGMLNQSSVETESLAKSVGMQISTLEALGSAIAGAGFTKDSIVDLMEEMNNKLGESNGLKEITPVTEALQILGLTFEEIQDLSPEEQFKKITNAALQMKDAQQAAAAMDIMMGAEANKVTGALRQQGKSIEEITAAYAKLSFRTEEGRQGARLFASQFAQAQKIVGSLTMQIAGLAGKHLAPLLNQFNDFAIANKKAINERLVAFFERLSRKAKDLSPAIASAAKGLASAVQAISSAISGLSYLVGGFDNLLVGLAGLMAGKLAMAVSSLAGSIYRLANQTMVALTGQTIRASAALAVHRIRVIAASVANDGLSMSLAKARLNMSLLGAVALKKGRQGITGLAAGIGRIIPIIQSFNATLLANPIVLVASVIVTSIGLISAVIYKYWEPIKAFVGGIFDGFSGAIEPIRASLAPLVEELAPVGKLFGVIGDAVGGVVDKLFNLFAPVEMTKEQMAGVASAGQKFGAILGGVFNVLLTPVRLLVDYITWILNKIGDVASAGKAVANFFGFGDDEEKPTAVTASQTIAQKVEQAGKVLPFPNQVQKAIAGQPQKHTPLKAGANNVFRTEIPTQIVVKAAPGMDEQEIARQVAAQLKQHERQAQTKQRAKLYDVG